MHAARSLVLLIVGSAPLAAASIFGHIQLSSPNDCTTVQVQLRALDSEQVISLPVDNHCRYGQANLPPGLYELTVQGVGYFDYASSSFQLTPDRILLHDPKLTPTSAYGFMATLKGFLTSNLGVVVATLALLAAVFELPRYFKRPTFVMFAKPTAPYCHTAIVTFRDEASSDGAGVFRCPIHFCRVWVANNGTNDANHVEAFATRLFREESLAGGGRKFVAQSEFRPMNLRWANSWQISKNPSTVDTAALIKKRISTRTGRFLDVGFIVHPPEVSQFVKVTHLPSGNGDREETQNKMALFLTLDAIGDDPGVALTSGKYILEIVIDCDTINAERFYLYLEMINWAALGPEIEIRPARDKELEGIAPRQARSLWIRAIELQRGNDGKGLLVP